MRRGEALARQIEAEVYDLEALGREADMPGPPPPVAERLQHNAIERVVERWDGQMARVNDQMLRRAL